MAFAATLRKYATKIFSSIIQTVRSSSALTDETTKIKPPEIIPNAYQWKKKSVSYRAKHSFAYPHNVFPDRYDQDQILGLHKNALVYFRFVYLHRIHGLYDDETLKQLIHAYSRLHMAKKGGYLVISLGVKLGLISDPSLYIYVAHRLAFDKEFQEASWFYTKIINKNIAEPHMGLYSEIVTGLIGIKEIKKALLLIDEMTSNHVFADLSIFTPVFTGFYILKDAAVVHYGPVLFAHKGYKDDWKSSTRRRCDDVTTNDTSMPCVPPKSIDDDVVASQLQVSIKNSFN
ncbi:hypothetical protein Tco_0299182 [Tanacetum coccineum]